jgi:hypothetical protein
MITIIKNTSNGKCIGRCVCGIEKEFYIQNIKSGKSKTCGCKNKAHIPQSVKRTFNLMNYRCNTKTSSDYQHWGAKGIKVLYKDVQEFYDDVGDKPTKLHSIDRINSKGNYEKGNCRWATMKEQLNNVSTNVVINYNEKSQTLAQWAEEYNIKYTTLRERLKRGWNIEDALCKKIEIKFNSRS